jgi:hypothetical protein
MTTQRFKKVRFSLTLEGPSTSAERGGLAPYLGLCYKSSDKVAADQQGDHIQQLHDGLEMYDTKCVMN